MTPTGTQGTQLTSHHPSETNEAFSNASEMICEDLPRRFSTHKAADRPSRLDLKSSG